jgi:murein DD-endopeptidase MepM/ murein hydrolase activator NlpD
MLAPILSAAVLAAATALSPLPSSPDAADSGRRAGAWPLRPEPEVVRRFDPPTTSWGAGHRGVDLAGTPGDRVRAGLGGTVTFAARLAGRGVVVVDHGRSRTTYEPVKASVTVGSVVETGAVVGTLEWFGGHCLPRACLHWGLIQGRDHYLDPMSLIGCAPQPVRLLPLDQPPPAPPPACASGVAAPRWVWQLERAAAAVRLVGAPVGTPAAGAHS